MEKKTSIFLIILLCILVAVAGGGTSYLFLADAHDQETQSLNNQIDDLESQVAKLHTESKTTTPTISPTTSTTTMTPTTTPAETTSNLKTYTNEKYGFSFVYPKTLTLQETENDLNTLKAGNIYKDAGIEYNIALYSKNQQRPVFTLWILTSIDVAIAAGKSVFGTKSDQTFLVGNIQGKVLNSYNSPGTGYIINKNKTYFLAQNETASDFSRSDYNSVLKSFIFN